MTAVVILHNVRSVHNVGAIFRTADAIGVDTLYLTGYTPAPIDRFGRRRRDLHKTALGAERNVSWKEEKDVHSLLKKLKNDGYYLIAVEQAPRAIDYKEIKVKRKTAFLFGNETEGLSEELLSLCDVIAEISMRGKKESLNVAVSAGIVLYRVLDQYGPN